VSDIAISGENNEMTKFQSPSSKLQRKSKQQAPMKNCGEFGVWNLSAWSFSAPKAFGVGVWRLVFGTFARSCLVFFVALALWPLSARAQTNAVAIGTNGNRFLFLIETSRAMKGRSAGVNAAVKDLLDSSMSGQLRRGDTLGIWTYNQKLYAGRFPLQQWSPESQRTVVTRVISFLQEQTYEHQAALPTVMPTLERLIKQSPFITVILISDGEQKMHGTPFDAAINKSYGTWEKEQEKARMPVLTILRAQAGKLNAYSVNAAPWPVDMPPLPKELLEAKVQKKAASPTPAPKPPPPIGQSLYLYGKKSQPAASSNSPASLTTNAPAVATPTNSSAPRLESSSAPTPASAASLLKPGSDASAPAISIAQESNSTPGKPAALVSPVSDGAKPVASLRSTAAAGVVETSASPAVLSPKPEPTQTISANASTDSNSPSAVINPPSSGIAAPATSGQPPAASAESPISSVQYPVSGLRIWMVVGSALAITVLLVLVWVRRSRSPRHISLITRSLDREKS
jgi:hypothetical protein